MKQIFFFFLFFALVSQGHAGSNSCSRLFETPLDFSWYLNQALDSIRHTGHVPLFKIVSAKDVQKYNPMDLEMLAQTPSAAREVVSFYRSIDAAAADQRGSADYLVVIAVSPHDRDIDIRSGQLKWGQIDIETVLEIPKK